MHSSATDDVRLGDRDIAEIANDVFLQSALETTIIRGATLEFYLTGLRAALLRFAYASLDDPGKVESAVIGLFCAMAQQCFLNEYVYAETDEESRLAARLRESLMQKLSAGAAIDPLLLAAVGAYFPLHTLPGAETLLAADWPASAADLLRQQVREPLEEAEDRQAIPALTSVDDEVSVRVMQQYEENPYPRWNVDPRAAAGNSRREPGAVGQEGRGSREESPARDILIAGCGTGEHPFDIARRFPDARVLAIDLSRTSLAYARRKTASMACKTSNTRRPTF